MNADQLILAVKLRPALWDTKHIGHNNRMLVGRLWSEVAEELGIDKTLAKSKWRGLRDYYRQEMKKQSTSINDQGITTYQSSWALYDQMSFIKNTILPRKQRDSASMCGPSDLEVENTLEYYEEDPINICIPKLEPQEATESMSDYSRVSPMPSDVKKEIKDIETRKRKWEEDSDDMQFFKSLLPDLVDLPRAKKSYIRLKIQEIIHREVHNNEGVVKDD